ncbi:arylsulfatase [Limibacter armeniacum]|uniref:arylsulfatase n=1 Tax=Limibacter armeniacum TaxID=466084 RepID=UPI002FE6A78F
MRILLISKFIFTSFLLLGSTFIQAQNKRPNIVFILVDNLGYGDLGAYGGGVVRGAPTPNIDKIANEGIKLTNFNVEAECTPTRSAIMTGRLPIRSGTSRVPLPGLPQGITPWEYTLAELLSDAGYNTAHYGKWHLGDVEGRYPTDQGFDEWFGIRHSTAESAWDRAAGFPGTDVVKNQGIWEGKKGEKSKRIRDYNVAYRPLMDEEITKRSVGYINKHAKDQNPFFLYVPFTLPHGPIIPNPKLVHEGKSDYQNVLMEIDHHTGEIMKALDENGLKENTLVIWASDNGPETLLTSVSNYTSQSDAGPFRGEFPSGWEGAIRTACVMRWPDKIPAGSTTNEIFTATDFYATLAHIVGAEAKIPKDRPMDSFNQLELLTGKSTKSIREEVMYFYGERLYAFKYKNFKVHPIVVLPPNGFVNAPGQMSTHAVPVELDYPWIFDIENDPKELWNVNVANGWLGVIYAKYMMVYEKSLKQYPNIKPGADGPKY